MTPRFLDLTGKTIGGILVVRELRGSQSKWLVARCGCGTEFHVARCTLQSNERTGSTTRCRSCRSRLKAERASRHGPRFGNPSGKRDVAPKGVCELCYDQSWRRPRGGFPCRCNGVYAPEYIPRATDILDSYAAPGRVWPEGGV